MPKKKTNIMKKVKPKKKLKPEKKSNITTRRAIALIEKKTKISIPKPHINLETVKHVARVARLELTEEEIKMMQKDLNDILAAFRDLEKIDPKCEPSWQPLDIHNVLRKDEIESCLGQEKALENTKHKERGFFKGPKVL